MVKMSIIAIMVLPVEPDAYDLSRQGLDFVDT